MSEPLWVPIGAVAAVGDELAYAQITAIVNITATTEAAANTIVTAPPISVDGATAVFVEFYTPVVVTPPAVSTQVAFVLYDGSTSLGLIGLQRRTTDTTADSADQSATFSRRLTPSAGTHTYSLRAYVSSGTGVISCGTGGPGQFVPAFIRVLSVRPTGVGAGGGGLLGYAEVTAGANITATTVAGANTIVAAAPVTLDGATAIIVECFTPLALAGTGEIGLWLFDGSTALGQLGYHTIAGKGVPFHVSRRFVPSAGSHTFSLRAKVDAGTGSFAAGPGGAAQNMPAFIRIVRDQ